jgi:hypothetical protein
MEDCTLRLGISSISKRSDSSMLFRVFNGLARTQKSKLFSFLLKNILKFYLFGDGLGLCALEMASLTHEFRVGVYVDPNDRKFFIRETCNYCCAILKSQ